MGPIRLLLVDDDPDFLASLQAFLERQGLFVDSANSETAATELLNSRHYDALIADLRLTGSDDAEGLHVIEHFKRLHPLGTAILVTAFATSNIRERAQTAGANGCLEKPTSCRLIRETLEEFGLL